MVAFGRDSHPTGEPETVIGPSVKVEGNFTGSGDVVVEGALSGTLKTTKSVRIGGGAKIRADIDAGAVFVAGEVRGNVRSTGSVELTSTAKVNGNVEAGRLRIESGATLNGKVTMGAAGTDAHELNERKSKREPAVA